MKNGEVEKLLEETEEKIFDISTDALREAGLVDLANKIDDIYYTIGSMLMEYSFEDEEEEN